MRRIIYAISCSCKTTQPCFIYLKEQVNKTDNMASRLFGFLTRYHRYAFKSLPYNVYNVNSPRQNPEAVLASLANYNSHL